MVDLSVSSDSVQPASLDVVADSAPGIPICDATPAQLAPANATLQAPRAAELLALAERTVRWEDDVTPAELRLFESLYLDVLRQARLELPDMPMNEAATGTPMHVGRDRTALLQLRVEACALVRRVAHTKRATRPQLVKNWRRLVLPMLSFALGALLMSRDSLAETFDWGNVSRGKTWVASSRYASDVSVTGVLDDFSRPFFFHTAQEKNPWLEVDLGAEIPARTVTITNRGDCCANRVAPLVVETSLDHHAWRTEATKRRSFSRWRARLDGEPVRWLRLRALRETSLHLKAVVVRK